MTNQMANPIPPPHPFSAPPVQNNSPNDLIIQEMRAQMQRMAAQIEQLTRGQSPAAATQIQPKQLEQGAAAATPSTENTQGHGEQNNSAPSYFVQENQDVRMGTVQQSFEDPVTERPNTQGAPSVGEMRQKKPKQQMMPENNAEGVVAAQMITFDQQRPVTQFGQRNEVHPAYPIRPFPFLPELVAFSGKIKDKPWHTFIREFQSHMNLNNYSREHWVDLLLLHLSGDAADLAYNFLDSSQTEGPMNYDELVAELEAAYQKDT
ncbi:MAG: hypothetical protein GY820_28100, partial [Gammaproteobacteria bacterium]|nr:hypothetical protein [Gammaproteobacteria bacterium]